MSNRNHFVGSRSLSKDFSIRFLIIIFLLSIFVFSSSSLALLKIQDNKFKQESSSIFGDFKKIIATPLWHYDDEEVVSICKTFLSGGIVTKIILFSDDNRLLHTFESSKEQNSTVASFTDDLYFDSKRIGKAEFYTRKDKYVENNKYYFITIIIGIALISVFISVSTHRLLQSYVNQPLEKLLNWVNQIEKGDYENAKINIDYPQREIQEIVHYFSVMVESIQKREQQIRESEERFILLFEYAPDPYYLSDMNGTFIDGNKAAEAMTGYKKEELIGKNFFNLNLISTDQLSLATSLLAKNKKGQMTGPDEFKIKAKDGREISAEILTFPMELDGHQTVLGIARDITKRKLMEDEKKKLEGLLLQTQKMEAIGTLAGGIAHDFNNILSSIIGYSELAFEDVKKDSLLRKYLQEVLVAGERAKDLVKQILTFSRQTEYERKPVQVKPVVEEVLKLLRSSLPTTIEIQQELLSDALILADPTQIHQILMNICTNAGHAMAEKGGVLKIDLIQVDLDSDFSARHPGTEPGPYLKLTVSDTGHGMLPDVLERIFEPFFTTKEKGEGTGMGLSVVHGIIQSFGGMITAYSEPGVGSVFNVFLPSIAGQIGIETKVESPIPTGTECILLIDDEEPLTDMGKRILESIGYDVVTRTSAIEALELFKSDPERFDVVITDLTMPKLTGDKLAGQLLKVKPDIPIILCTGFSSMIDENKAKAMGIRGFIYKPVLKRDIAETIRKVLDENKR